MPKTDTSGMPGIRAMEDTMEFMKSLWGGMGIPGAAPLATSTPGMGLPNMMMPTLSVEEINKRISELKAVESWLNLNLNMLRGTIQALEVQSATIATLQSMGESLNAAVAAGADRQSARPQEEASSPDSKSPAAAGAENNAQAGASAAFAAPLINGAAWWNMLQDQFKQAVTQTMAQANASAAGKPADTPQDAAASKRKSPKS